METAKFVTTVSPKGDRVSKKRAKKINPAKVDQSILLANDLDQIKFDLRTPDIELEINPDIKSFTFVDLFAGIGGFRIPLQSLGGNCLGFSEIDKAAIETYKTNFLSKNESEIELGDITKLNKLPFNEIDLICGGVPCQAWSVAGKMKGFEDPRGKLWEDTIRVVRLNKPKAFIFENVKGLMDPRNKENLQLIIDSLTQEGYQIKYKLLNSYDFGLPQNRDRIYIVGIRTDLAKRACFNFPEPINKKSYLHEILDESAYDYTNFKKIDFLPVHLFGDKIPMGRNRFQKTTQLNDFFVFCDTRNGHSTIHSWDIIPTTEREKLICLTILKNRRKKVYGPADGNPIPFDSLKNLIDGLTKNELDRLVELKILRFVADEGYDFTNSKNSAGINGIYRIYLPHSNIFSTLTATGTKDFVALKTINASSAKEYKKMFLSEIFHKNLFRSITSKEAGRLQGFPIWFKEHPTDHLAKKQFGNAVSTNVVYYLAKELLKSKVFNF